MPDGIVTIQLPGGYLPLVLKGSTAIPDPPGEELSLVEPGSTAFGDWSANSESQIGSTHPVTFSAATNRMSGVATGTFRTGMLVYFSNSGGALPAELTAGENYYIRDLGDGTWSIHDEYLGATGNTNAIDLGDAGTGTHTLTPFLLDEQPKFHWITGYDESIVKTALLAAYPDLGVCDSDEILILFYAEFGNGVASAEVSADEGEWVNAYPIAQVAPEEPKDTAAITTLAESGDPFIAAIYAAKLRTAEYETAGWSNMTGQSEIRARIRPHQAGVEYVAQGITANGNDYDNASLRLFIDTRTSPTRYYATVDPTGTCVNTTGVFDDPADAENAGLATTAMYASISTAIDQIRAKPTAADDNLNNAVIFLRDGVYLAPTAQSYNAKTFVSIVKSANAVGTPRMFGGFSSDAGRFNCRRVRFRGIDWHIPFAKAARYTVTSVDTGTNQVTVSSDLSAVSDGVPCNVFPLGAGALPAVLDWKNPYYIHIVSSGASSVVTLHTSRSDAERAADAVDLADAGTLPWYIERCTTTFTRHTFTVNAATDVLTLSAGGTVSGDIAGTEVEVYALGADTLPSPLTNGGSYYLSATGTNTAKLYTTKEDAAGETNAIDIDSSGSGTFYLWIEPAGDASGFVPNSGSPTQHWRFENVAIWSSGQYENMIPCVNSRPTYVNCTTNRCKHGPMGVLVQGCVWDNTTEDQYREQSGSTYQGMVIDSTSQNGRPGYNFHPDIFHLVDNVRHHIFFNVKWLSVDTQFVGCTQGGSIINAIFKVHDDWNGLSNCNNYPLANGTPQSNTTTLHVSSSDVVTQVFRDGELGAQRSSTMIGCTFEEQTVGDHPNSAGGTYDVTTDSTALRRRIWAANNIYKQQAVSGDFRIGDYWTEEFAAPESAQARAVTLDGLRTVPVDIDNNPRTEQTVGAIEAEA